MCGLSSARTRSLHNTIYNRIHNRIHPPKTACGCPCDVFKISSENNGYKRNPLTLWNAFDNILGTAYTGWPPDCSAGEHNNNNNNNNNNNTSLSVAATRMRSVPIFKLQLQSALRHSETAPLCRPVWIRPQTPAPHVNPCHTWEEDVAARTAVEAGCGPTQGGNRQRSRHTEITRR